MGRGPLAALLVAALAMGAVPPAPAQSDEERARSELQQLRRDIDRINREIASARARRDSLQQQLRDTELRLGSLQRDLASGRLEVDAARRRLAELEQRRGELEQARDRQQERVIEEIRAAWQMGGEAPLKVLLNQQDPNAVSRMLAYYGYVLEARSALLEGYRETLHELEQTRQEIAATGARLEAGLAELEQQQARLEQTQAERAEAVASLSADISAKGSRLEQLEQDRARLEELLAAIEEAVINLQVPENYQPFAKARGSMPWPVAGQPSNRFGHARNEGKMRWQGVMIPAEEGATVQAIHHGRVVYSDWFRGSGLLLIIDHGDGYMSLYAHNQSLLREVGEWVTAGSPVSTVGSSGGRDRPALYFEVRKDGKPVDPAAWCRRG